MFDFISIDDMKAGTAQSGRTAGAARTGLPQVATRTEIDQLFEQWAEEDTFLFADRAVTEAKGDIAGSRGEMHFSF